MGFFSWDCRACGKSVRSAYTNAGHGQWMTKAVAVTRGGAVVHGEYDGYGRLDDFELVDAGPFTIWHLACWEHGGRPVAFDGEARSAEDQGHFCDEVLTLFPPGHDAVEVRRRHVAEIVGILDEIGKELPALDLKDGFTFDVILRILRRENKADLAESLVRGGE